MANSMMTRKEFKERVNTISSHLTYPVLDDLHEIDDHDAEQRQLIEQLKHRRRQVGWFHIAVLFIGLSCLVYWGNGNHLAVEVPVYDGANIQRLQQERDSLKRERDDYKVLAKQLQAMVKTSNATVAQLTAQLHALAVSVPPQPVVLAAVQQEVATERGFRQVVARSFGKDIAAHIKVKE